jgi:hypothetical protein
MGILKTESTSQGKLIGAYFGNRVYNYMTLFCIAKGTLKSRILTKLILGWISAQKWGGNTETRLIDQIIAKINVQRTKRSNKDLGIDEFREKIEDELIKKGLPLDIIAKILLEII